MVVVCQNDIMCSPLVPFTEVMEGSKRGSMCTKKSS